MIVVRTMDDGDGGPDYRLHVDVTSLGCPAQISGPPEGCYPAEPAEYQVVQIDAEVFGPDGKTRWVDIDKTDHTKEQREAVWSWAEGLDLSEDVVEDAAAEREAYEEQRGEFRRDALDEERMERDGR